MEESLCVILPAFNEEENIKNVVSDVISHIRNYGKNFEVIVVNDGSTDRTLKMLGEIKTLYPELKIVSYGKNKGYGWAIRKGIEFSQKEWIFIMDLDGQFRIDDFEIFWNNRKSYDFILGYRAIRRDNTYRLWLSKLGNYIANLFLEKKVKDINCGFKLFKLSDLRNISLISTNGCIYFEILFYLLKSKNKFLQLPIQHHRRKAGKQSGGNLRIVLRNLLEGRRIVCCK